MENYNNIDYNSLVYGSMQHQQQQPIPMTEIPDSRDAQIVSHHHLGEPMQLANPEIMNLSYQRESIIAHNLPEQMGLYPTGSLPHQMQQQPNLQLPIEMQQQHPEIPENQQSANIQYQIGDVGITVNLDVQNNNENFNENTEILENPSEVPDTIEQSAVANEDPSLEDGQPLVDGNNGETENIAVDQLMEGEVPIPVDPPVKQEPEINPNQCRVCKATENLVDIYRVDDEFRLSDIMMKISNIRVHGRDYLPKLICEECVVKLKAAFVFKTTCENTDKEFRQMLKRSKKVARKRDFVLIDANEFSESGEDDDWQEDDDDFKVSDLEVESEEDITSDDSFDEERKKTPKKRGPKPKNKTPVVGQKRTRKQKFKKEQKSAVKRPLLSIKKDKIDLSSTAKRLKRDIVYIEAKYSSDEGTGNSFTCKECDEEFDSKVELREHRKIHLGQTEAPFKCNVCSKGFKYQINLTSHMQIHKENYPCDECGKAFNNKLELKKHTVNDHKQTESTITYECSKCKKFFSSLVRYEKHRESCSAGGKSVVKVSSRPKPIDRKFKEETTVPSSGRDLFKTVAPTTSTYWSDSFSD